MPRRKTVHIINHTYYKRLEIHYAALFRIKLIYPLQIVSILVKSGLYISSRITLGESKVPTSSSLGGSTLYVILNIVENVA